MKIKIAIYNHGNIKSIYADEELNQFTIDNTEITSGISNFIHSTMNIISNWPDKITNENGDNDLKYKIAFSDGNTAKRIESYGKLPNDFYKLSKLIAYYEDPVLYKTHHNFMPKNNEKGGL